MTRLLLLLLLVVYNKVSHYRDRENMHASFLRHEDTWNFQDFFQIYFTQKSDLFCFFPLNNYPSDVSNKQLVHLKKKIIFLENDKNRVAYIQKLSYFEGFVILKSSLTKINLKNLFFHQRL